MKKTLLLFFIVFCGSLIINAQNLIPNWSFEDTVHCPNGYSQSTYAQGWTININSADYFHACNTTNWFSTPNANAGYQCPANGNAYCGFYAYLSFNPAYSSELIGCQLTSPLIIGQKYYLSFKVSLANLFNCGLDKLGAVFTNVYYGDTLIAYPASKFNGLKIYSSAIITDTANWITIRASFYPDSAFNYVLFGNLSDTNNFNNFICFDTTITDKVSYYYLDDVCVSTDSLTCEISNGLNVCDTLVNIFETNYTKESITIYPIPTDGKIIIEFKDFHNKCDVTISDIRGKIIKFYSIYPSENEISLKDISSGLYFIHMSFNNKTIVQKLIIN